MIGTKVTVRGLLVPTEGMWCLRDEEGRRWTFKLDQRSRALIGKIVVAEGEVIAPRTITLLEVREATGA